MPSLPKKHAIAARVFLALAAFAAVIVILLAVIDWNALRPVLARMITAKTGRSASIDGPLTVHIWSLNPTIAVEGLRIQNPSWADRDRLLTVKKILVQISLGRLLTGHLVLPRVELTGPELNLERDSSGRMSWTSERPSSRTPAASPDLPAVRRLVIQDGKLHVADHIRLLSFDGTLRADERANTPSGSAFRLDCAGSLNSRSFRLEATGGPLINVDPTKPYELQVQLHAADISVITQISIPKPFDLAEYDARFTINGDDLADVYYLTNLALPNTPHYALSADLIHRGDSYVLNRVRGKVGSSDLEGMLSLSTGAERPRLTGNLVSTNLDIADLAPTLGAQAPATAGGLSAVAAPAHSTPAIRQTPRAAPALLLPDADLQVKRLRAMDADIQFTARSVTSAKIPLKQLDFHLLLTTGKLRLDPLAFTLPEGRFAGSVQIDATHDDPVSDIDMSLTNVDLAQFKAASAAEPPLQGTLAGRVQLHGAGSSVHKFASGAQGTLSAVIPQGQIRAVFAELTGVNITRSLGLLLTQNQQEIPLRCGVAAFDASSGRLTTRSFVLDTRDVLISGHGNIDLRTERIDLALQGDPKKLRLLRVRAPVIIQGTLSKPSIGVEADKALVQAGAATVLGVLLTPVAAVLAFIDPGLAKNADCAGLMAQVPAAAANAAVP